MSASRSRRFAAALVAPFVALAALALAAPAPAAADITLGVFAPAARFGNMQARIDLGQQLAAHLSSITGEQIKSRAYAQADDFDKASREGLALALVDATHLVVSGGPAPRVLAAAPYVKWQLISRQVRTVSELRGKRLSLAAVGKGAERRLLEGLFEGEARQLFPEGERLSVAQDSASAEAALALGKADAALLPEGVQRPAGEMVVLLEFPAMPGLVLVAYPPVKPDAYERIRNAAASFHGADPLPSLLPADGDVLATVRQRLTVAPRRAPLPTLTLRSLIDSLIESPSLTIPQRSVQDFAISPIGGSAPTLATPAPVTAAPTAVPSPTRRR